MNRGSNVDLRLERKVLRIWLISDFLLRIEFNDFDGLFDEYVMDREDFDYFDDDMEEMEMEIEMLSGIVVEEEVRFRGIGMLFMLSLNL